MKRLATDEVPPGYKQTEVGVIPEDWDVMPLGEIGDVKMCKRVLKNQTRGYGDVPFFKIGTFGGAADAYISQSLFNEFRRKFSFPKKGDILISAAGTIGRAVIYDGAPAYFQDSNIVWISNDELKALNTYLWHRYQVTKWSVSHGGTVARLYNDNLRTKIHIPLPPTLVEQEAIAGALSDADGLIESLEKLIAKKRVIKQGAMQELLTGKRRLPGFEGKPGYKQTEVGVIPEDWEVLCLRTLLVQPATYGIVKAGEFTQSGVPMLRGGDIKNGRVSTDLPQVSIEISSQYQRTVLRRGDVVIALVGYPGESAVIPEELIGSNISRAVGLLRLSTALISLYLVAFLNSTSGRKEFLKPGAGSAQLVVNLKDLNLLNIPIPLTLAEQEAIATVLSDMDAEIEALEAKLTKARQIKQGMMQELLTGRIRLV